MKELKKLTLLFTILVVAFTPLDAIEISEDSGITLGRYFFIAMTFFAFWSKDIVLTRSVSIFKTLVCFIIWALMTATWSINPEISIQRVLYLIQYSIIFIVMVNVLTTQKRLKLAIIGWILATVYIAVNTIMDFAQNAYTTKDLYRVYDFGNSNENSFMLCYGLIFCYIIDKTRLRIPSVLMTVISAFAIAANGARMGAILFIIALFAFCTQLWQSKKQRWYILALVPCLIVGGVYMYEHLPKATLMRMMGIAENIESGKLANRENIWAAALEMLHDNPLWCLLGSGWGTFNLAIEDYLGRSRGAHNFYLDLLTTTGIVGLGIVLYYLWQLWGIIRKTKKTTIINYLMLGLPMISMFSTNWQSRRWWFMMGAIIYLIYTTGNFAKHERAKIKS